MKTHQDLEKAENLTMEVVRDLNRIVSKINNPCDAYFFYFSDEKNYCTSIACSSILNKNYELVSTKAKHRNSPTYPEFSTDKYLVQEKVVDLFDTLPDLKNADCRTAVFRINADRTYRIDFAINDPYALSLHIFHIGQPNSYFKPDEIELTEGQAKFIADFKAVRAASNDEEDEDDDSGHA